MVDRRKPRLRGIFVVAAATLFSLFLVNLILLKETPLAMGESEPPANPLAIVVEPHHQPSRPDLWPILQPLFLDSGFWMVCAVIVWLSSIVAFLYRHSLTRVGSATVAAESGSHVSDTDL